MPDPQQDQLNQLFPALALQPPTPPPPVLQPGAQPALAQPQVSMAPPGQPRSTLGAITPLQPQPQNPQTVADQQKLNDLKNSKSAIENLQTNHPVWGGILRGLDVAGSMFAPKYMSMVPGTTLNHQQKIGQAQGAVTSDLAGEKEAAQTADLQSKPELAEAKNETALTKVNAANELGQAKLAATQAQNTEKNAAERSRIEAALAKNGQKTDADGKIVPMDYAELSPLQQSHVDMASTSEALAKANTDYKKAMTEGIPAKLAIARAALQNASQGHEIARQNLLMRSQEFEMRSQGTVNGVQPAGGMQTETGAPVGTAFQNNVRPTTASKTAAERTKTISDLDANIRQGLNDPEIQQYMGPGAGRLAELQGEMGMLPEKVAQFYNDLKSYSAFQASMHPTKGLGALEYFHKIMGGLGQTPEQLIGKLDSNKSTASSVKRAGAPRVNTGAGGTPHQGGTAGKPNDPMGVR